MRLIDADAFKYYVLDGKPIGLTICQYSENDILSMIRAQPTITPEPNPPLTLEELRTIPENVMVWVERINGIDHKDNRFAFVNWKEQLCRTVDGCNAFFELYGKTWLAYRRKPEEVQEND